VRKALGVRTAFNILGPMTNPAGAQHVVIGVFEEELMPLMAGALREVGYIERGVIVHGCGLDEVSPLGPSRVIELRNTVRVQLVAELALLCCICEQQRVCVVSGGSFSTLQQCCVPWRLVGSIRISAVIITNEHTVTSELSVLAVRSIMHCSTLHCTPGPQ
jgi:Glycosyl transferase family, a/b domain